MAYQEVYSGDPLIADRREIRILALAPGTGHDVLRGDLMVKSLAYNHPHYTALSYTWFGQVNASAVVIGGVPLHITENLASALRRFRNPVRPKDIWVETICINPNDDKEKRKQFSLIGEIFASATETMVWLGEKSDDSDVAMDFVRFGKDLDATLETRAVLRAVTELMQRNWWTCVWLMEEVLMSQSVTVVCGDQEVDMVYFTRIFKGDSVLEFRSKLIRDEVRMQTFRIVLSQLGLAERPLRIGKERVRWRCGCGRSLYDDFTELRSGAAAELEKWLNDPMRKHAGSGTSSHQQNAALRSTASPNAGVPEYQQTTESDISLQPVGETANTLSVSTRNAAVALDVHLEKCWLILCGNMMRGPDILLTQLNLSSTPSDKSLFDEMKDVYSNLRKAWSLRSLLRGVKTIRFVQFQLHKSARVDIRKTPDMPPETRRDEYLYEPCDLMPPVGENFMTHWFHHPEEAWELPWAYSLFPKRRRDELEVNLNHAPTVGWGIQIVEGWLGSRLWLLGLSLFLCGSLAFAICWTVLEHDIQGAFGVSAYVIALLTLAVGAAQANFG